MAPNSSLLLPQSNTCNAPFWKPLKIFPGLTVSTWLKLFINLQQKWSHKTTREGLTCISILLHWAVPQNWLVYSTPFIFFTLTTDSQGLCLANQRLQPYWAKDQILLLHTQSYPQARPMQILPSGVRAMVAQNLGLGFLLGFLLTIFYITLYISPYKSL